MMTYIKSLDIHIKEHIVHIYLFDHIYILALSYGCARFNLGPFFAKTEIEPKYSVFIKTQNRNRPVFGYSIFRFITGCGLFFRFFWFLTIYIWA